MGVIVCVLVGVEEKKDGKEWMFVLVVECVFD